MQDAAEPAVVGVDVGGTKIAAARVAGASARDLTQRATDISGPEAVLDGIEAAVREVVYAPLRAPQEETATIRKQETVTPPYLLVKEVPKLPIEIARKYQRRMVIVYAIMDTQGKLDQILVMQSPAAQLTDLILEALNKWVFRPAELNGQPVSIKLLLGVPVFPSE